MIRFKYMLQNVKISVSISLKNFILKIVQKVRMKIVEVVLFADLKNHILIKAALEYIIETLDYYNKFSINL